MNTEKQKVLQEIAGKPLVLYILSSLRKAKFKNVIMVVGYKKDEVIKEVGPGVIYANQTDLLGTGDALKQALNNIPNESDDVLVVNGDDSAFYLEDTLEKIMSIHKKESAKVTFTSLIKENPEGLGRVIRNDMGEITGIVEEKETDDTQKMIREVNIGLYVFNVNWVKKNINKIEKSQSGEYYIIDLIKIAIRQGDKLVNFRLKDENEWFGKMRSIVADMF
jgi:bifunctional UDP-N-acetylglucosamine pyrophosphorylase/glucosamine-1-phosphate N-acetyltransferase